MNNIAICIPTYGRSDVIEELLIRCGKYIKESGYDIYIFDSSKDNNTEKVCKKYKDRYVSGYKRIDSSVHSNAKVYMIYQDSELLDKYDYIWICSDSIRWSQKVLKSIKNYKDSDFIIVNHRDKEEIGCREYSDINKVFQDAAWIMTLYGATIVNTKTVLRDVDWKKYEKKYLLPECINLSHVCFYFERMAEMKKVKVGHISVSKYELAASPLKSHSGWHDEIYKVWWEYWYNAIMKLPDVYTDKESVIKKHGVYSEIFNFNAMLRLRAAKRYGLAVFVKYVKRIPLVTDVSLLQMLLIAVTPPTLVEYRLKKPQRKFVKNLKRFVKKYPKIYIYGCGNDAGVAADFMKSQGIDYKGFCVSQIGINITAFRGKQVVEYNDSLLEDGKVGIILGMHEKNVIQVLDSYFTEKEKRERVFEEFRYNWAKLYY